MGRTAVLYLLMLVAVAGSRPFRDLERPQRRKSHWSNEKQSIQPYFYDFQTVPTDNRYRYNSIKADGTKNPMMTRSPRGSRQYDVPQVECPTAPDGMDRFSCPTPDRQGRFYCIDDHVLCDGFIDCPGGQDEDRHACMFYKTTKAHLDVFADALLRWARGY